MARSYEEPSPPPDPRIKPPPLDPGEASPAPLDPPVERVEHVEHVEAPRSPVEVAAVDVDASDGPRDPTGVSTAPTDPPHGRAAARDAGDAAATRQTAPERTPPAYTREHTAADPSAVRTEREVANTDRAVPSDKPLARVAAFVGGIVAIVGAALVAFWGLHLLGTLVALAGLLLAASSILVAYGDRRTGIGTPALCTAVAGAALIIALVFWTGREADPPTALTPTAGTGVVDDRAQTAGGTIGRDGTIPADPAQIVEGN